MAEHYLPSQPTPFIGREHELSEITNLLADSACRLLTLTGLGGIGKTRLAIEAARLIIDPSPISPPLIQGGNGVMFPNGIYFVSLQPLTAPDFIVSTIAEALQFAFYGEGDPRMQLLSYLRNQQLLLLLDNFEHLLDGLDLLSEIVERAPSVKLLVTSRERLRLREEWVFDVGGLNFPEQATSDALVDFSAVQLFMQSARRAGHTPSAADIPSIIRICQLVEGMPLAIELAAAWVRAMSLVEIGRQIEHSLDILTTATRNVPEKHRSMRAAFEHSWRLLTEAEQAVFSKLSVFRGGFSREAAEYVADASLAILASLVDKSLLHVHGSGRYDIHELLRQYADEQLSKSPDENEAVHDRHSTYYAAFLHKRRNDPKGERYRQGLAEFSGDIDIIRVAWLWAIEHGRYEHIHGMWEALMLFYSVSSWLYEGLEFFTQSTERLKSESNNNEWRANFVRVLLLQGWFRFRVGYYVEAKRLVQKSLDLWSDLKNEVCLETAICYSFLGFVTHAFGEYEEARLYLQKARELCSSIGESYYESTALYNLGRTAHSVGEPQEAKRHLLAALALVRRDRAWWGEAYILSSLASVALAMGDYDDARSYLKESIDRFSDINDLWGLTLAVTNLGRTVCAMGDDIEGWRCFHEALNIAAQIRVLPAIMDALLELAILIYKAGAREWAVELVALVIHQPGSWKDTLDRAGRWLHRIDLPQTIVAEARARGITADLDTVLKKVLTSNDEFLKRLAAGSNQGQNLVVPLSERELEILRLIASGVSVREVAHQLYLSISTVRWYLNQIYGKLDSHNRIQAIARARELKLLA